MELYHGSPDIVEKPMLGLGNPQNDYGLGFYCTESLELAKEWACRVPQDGFANRYEIELEGLKILDLSDGRWHILNWLAILLQNRSFDVGNPLARDVKDYVISTFSPECGGYDIIRGYRADDSYFSFAKAFLNGNITLDALAEAMRLGKLGEQYCLKSEMAFERLQYVSAVPADWTDYYVKRNIRDRKAREDYAVLLSRTDTKEGFYAIDILRQHWSNNDERLR